MTPDTGPATPSVLVVYYSLSGTTRLVAHTIARALSAPVGEIRDAVPRSGGWGRLRSVLEVLLGHRPSIDYVGPEPQPFAVIVLGGPTWAARLASPLASFASCRLGDTQRLAVFTTCGSPNGWHAVRRFRPGGNRPVVARHAFRIDAGRTPELTSEVDGFVRAIRESAIPPATAVD